MGQCPSCRAWNSFVEEMPVAAHPGRRGFAPAEQKVRALRLDEVDPTSLDRISTGVPEIDRVLGGGIVAGSSQRTSWALQIQVLHRQVGTSRMRA